MSIKITKAHILWFNNSNSRNLSFNYSHTCVQSHTNKLFVVMLIMAKVEKQISILIHTHSLTHFSNIYYLVTSYQVLWPMIFTYLLIYTFLQHLIYLHMNMYIHICACVCSVASALPYSLWPRDSNLAGSSVHGIFPARILEWVVMPSSNWFKDWTHVSCISCIGRRILYRWATGEAHIHIH